MTSHLEQQFALAWRVIHGQPYQAEHKFCAARKWRFDFAWPAQKVAVEVEGGVWSKGRHTRGSGYIGDCAKYNTAALDGWRVIRLAGDMVNDIELLKRIKCLIG
jgi:very-short-patch-repair endonuclease